MKWYLQVLKKYANVNGRASRTKYWMFTLFNFVFCIVIVVGGNRIDNVSGYGTFHSWYRLIWVLYFLVMIIPSIAVGVRRLHDIGKSSWMVFYILVMLIFPFVVGEKISYRMGISFWVLFIPFLISKVWLCMLFCKEGDLLDNKYGTNPKDKKLI